MTETQFKNRVRALANRTKADIIRRAGGFVKTGAVNLADYQNDYRLPKAFLSAACKTMAEQWEPLDDNGKEDARNIYLMI
jgi:hypothetical protein